MGCGYAYFVPQQTSGSRSPSVSSKKQLLAKYRGCYPRSISPPGMQHDEHCGILKRRRAALRVAIVLRNYEWTLH
jgi:hypothetical protein